MGMDDNKLFDTILEMRDILIEIRTDQKHHKTQLDSHESRICEIEKKPVKRLEGGIMAFITAIIGAIVGAIAAVFIKN